MEISKQKSLMARICKDQQDYVRPLQALKAAYEALEIGDFNQDVLDDVSNNQLEGIKTQYMTAMNSEVEQSGIKSSKMKAVLLSSCEEAITDLETSFNNLLEAVSVLDKKRAEAKILTTALEHSASGLEKQYGFSDDPTNRYKRLTIGHQSWVATKCNKSWPLEYCTIMYRPGLGDVYIYARCPVNNTPGKLEVHYEPMPNTNKEYMILIKTGTYEEVSF